MCTDTSFTHHVLVVATRKRYQVVSDLDRVHVNISLALTALLHAFCLTKLIYLSSLQNLGQLIAGKKKQRKRLYATIYAVLDEANFVVFILLRHC